MGAQSAITSGQVTIVDVRRADDYNAGHIPGAINLPFDQWDRFEGTQKKFPGLRKDRFTYVYCYETLCQLSQLAARKFASLGFAVKEIKGGFKSWVEHKYPVQK